MTLGGGKCISLLFNYAFFLNTRISNQNLVLIDKTLSKNGLSMTPYLQVGVYSADNSCNWRYPTIASQVPTIAFCYGLSYPGVQLEGSMSTFCFLLRKSAKLFQTVY